MIDGLFDDVLTFPDSDARKRYQDLVGLDEIKERLEKQAEALLRPDLFDTWSREHHGSRIGAIDLLSQRPPLFIFAGDVGTGKTELAMTCGDQLARTAHLSVELFPLSLRARGTGAVGEMTRLISEAFKHVRTHCPKTQPKKKPNRVAILLVDEADALAQSRELAQMHHEDRAGVNALVRGIDDIAKAKLPVLTIMCSNRLTALDPAVRRRAAAVFEFKRPTLQLRKKLLAMHLAGSGLNDADINAIAKELGETNGRDYEHTYSDITERFIPSLILNAYPTRKITRDLAIEVVGDTEPTPPFQSES
jgi:AAA+ superfamily predicted ATPase